METIGVQYLADICNVSNNIITDVEWLYDHFRHSLIKGKMNIVGEGKRHTFSNGGSTFLFILQESHASLHSYPEFNYIAVDIFVCAGKDPSKSIKYFIDGLNSDVKVSRKILERGNNTGMSEE